MGFLMTILGYLVPFLVVLSVVVFVHEYGHFIVGRWCGIKADAFSLGFGPELLAFDDRKGTRWRIAAIPLGGYVKFHGDANGASIPDPEAIAAMPEADRAVSFAGQVVWKRAATVFAGPLFNFLLAIAIFAGMFGYFGKPVLVDGAPVLAPRLAAVLPKGAGEAAGFKAGDMVRSVDGAPIESFAQFQRVVSASAGKMLRITVLRDGVEATLEAVPADTEVEVNGKKTRVGRLGLNASDDFRDMKMQPCGPVEALGLAVQETWNIVAQTGRYLTGLIAGRESASQLSGPIGIAEASGKMAQQIPKLGVWPLVNLIALLSVSVGLLNLFPVPLLDGGHLMFFAIEAVRGRALNDRLQEYAFRVGLALVCSLMLFATYNDLARHLRHFAGFGL
ncbi:MAG TPA: RIP metalloprotease RseP [Methylocystis sp.]|nr:RIP metalloprotease RseP [Methylocystis sp.]